MIYASAGDPRRLRGLAYYPFKRLLSIIKPTLSLMWLLSEMLKVRYNKK
jgi:hypothetical protein